MPLDPAPRHRHFRVNPHYFRDIAGEARVSCGTDHDPGQEDAVDIGRRDGIGASFNSETGFGLKGLTVQNLREKSYQGRMAKTSTSKKFGGKLGNVRSPIMCIH